MIAPCTAKEDRHFHEEPRTAHRNHRNWLRRHHPDLLEAWDQLWGIYGALGYGGLDDERAEQAITILKESLTELGGRRLQLEVYMELGKTINEMKEINGVIGLILFVTQTLSGRVG